MDNTDDPILRTEDGHPIGELVMADATTVPTVPNEETVKNNRAELLRQNAIQITGDPNADGALAELYPGFGNVDIRKQARDLYLVEHKGIDDIALATGLPSRTISMWIWSEQWDEVVRREIEVKRRQSILDTARLRSEMADVLGEQAEQARRIRSKATDNITNDVGSLKSNTEAWTAAAKVEHTIYGVSEAGEFASGTGEAEKSKEQQKEGKVPLVNVFVGGLPPIRKSGEVIDV